MFLTGDVDMRYRITGVIIAAIFLLFAIGCSNNGSPIAPGTQAPAAASYSANHYSWGLWHFTGDEETGSLDAVQLREGNFHLNALPFLEPPPLLNLTIESVEFNGDVIETDIGLRHPFLGMNKFTGFDVCGIFITSGSVSGFTDPALLMAGEGEARLLNPDGYSRWWNPAEFPVNPGTMYGYKDGLLGATDASQDYNCTLNAYKYYCDDLDDISDTLADVTLENRGMFSAGQKNVRHYTIEKALGPLAFNYAVDACWKMYVGYPPIDQNDFPPDANRVEAWRIDVTEMDNSLYYEDGDNGGDLSLSVDIYNWFDPDLNIVRVEAPGQVPATASSVAVNGGAGYSTYQVDIFDCTPSAAGELELLITVESEETGYGGLLPGEEVSAYFTITVEVDDEVPQLTGCPDVTNQAYPFTATPTTEDWRWCYLMPVVSGDTFSESCIDYDFLNNDQDRLVVNGRDSLNQIGALTPVLYSHGLNPEVFITGVETCSIDCDLTDRIVYVLFDDSVLGGGNDLDVLIPLRTDVVEGADTTFHVYDISEASEIGTGYNVDAKIWAIETDAYDNIWVLDENRYMHHFINNGSSYTEDTETGFDLDDTIPSFSGIVYDMGIDYYNEAFYILTNGAEDGILYRVECDGAFNTTVEGNANPMLNVWQYTNNDRADIVIDNLDSSGNILQGEQDAQILCVANIPGDHFGDQSWMASKIGITRVDAALGSAVKYTFTGNENVGYGACCSAINSRTNSMYTKCGPPYGNQYIVQTIFVPTSEWY